MSDTYTLTMDAYTLTMDAETARVVSRACEFYARILMGKGGETEWMNRNLICTLMAILPLRI